MKHNINILNILYISIVSIFLVSCAKDEHDIDRQKSGYAQFHIAKSISSTKGDQIESFNKFSKIRISLTSADGKLLTQSLSLEKYDNSQYDIGMLSEKLELPAGQYNILRYDLLDNVETVVDSYEFNDEKKPGLNIKGGGLTIHELLANVAGNGYVQFRLIKDEAAPNIPTKSGESGVSKYPFHQIQFVEIYLKDKYTEKEIKLKGYGVKHNLVTANDNKDYISGVGVIDTTYSLPVGEYEVVKYITYRNKTVTGASDYYEICDKVKKNSFTVLDNTTINAEVPVKLVESAPYIKDAYTLYKIWMALDGPNWKYKGKDYPKGANWQFENRDIDMWSAQPGVSILSNGRVAVLNLAGFGAKGDMPECLGDLEDLRQLYLGGSRNDPSQGELETKSALPNLNNLVTEEELKNYSNELLKQFGERYSYNGITKDVISDELLKAYDYTDKKLQAKRSGSSIERVKGTSSNSPIFYQSLITSLPKTIGKLKKLETLYVSCTPISTLPAELSECVKLANMEVFKCPNLTEMPESLGQLPNLSGLVFAGNENVSSESLINGLRKMNAAAASDEIQGCQILYLNDQKMKYLPDLTNLNKLRFLNAVNCGIEYIEKAFGKDHYLAQLILTGNKLKSLPKDDKGYFMALHSDFEYLGLSNNLFEDVPDVFLGNSIFKLGTIDLSNNKIRSFENGTNWNGIHVEVLNLAYNKLTEFPLEIYPKNDKCSKISFLQLQGNLIDTIRTEALEGDNTFYLTALDLSLNRLRALPASFNRMNLPYLSGLQLSYNRFEKFMFSPLNIPSLAVYMFNGQRDKNGNKCMREWPVGISGHLGMRNLYLADNDIRLVDDEISPNIWVLDISGNHNIVIDLTKICPYIKANRFFLLYSPSQDIRGCDALDLN